MKLPLSWLKEYVEIDDTPKSIADKLLNIGFEVEEIVYTGAGIKNVVTCKIEKIIKHPDADRLYICNISTGKENLTIVTAATNIKEGDIVPVALDNAHLPTDKIIVRSPLKGVMSDGMFCSGKELMIDNNVIDGAEENGILILPNETVIGEDIKEVLGLNDYIFDISVTANRPDCQSIYGISREIAAVYGKKIKPLETGYKIYECGKSPDIKIVDKDLCLNYHGTVVKDIKIGKSPKIMRMRLRSCGIRAINNIVDITNYVLLEVGQPLHAFDLNNIEGGIRVRRAKDGEVIKALDGKDYLLKNDMLVIADFNKPLAIAGVMGGEYSGVSDDTKEILLEAAVFTKGNIRATSRALGLRSDSSARYEKGVYYGSSEIGKNRALCLFDKLACGKVTSAVSEDGVKAPDKRTVITSVKQIETLLGIEIRTQICVEILSSLDFEVKEQNGNLICGIPDYRTDVDNYTDLAEEVIRFYGYDKLNDTLLKAAKTTVGGKTLKQKNIDIIKSLLCSLGANESLTYSFVNPKQYEKLNGKTTKEIIIKNPLGEDFSAMRTQLTASMLESISFNLARKSTELRLFEVSRIYLPKKLPITELPDERETLCIAFVGKNEDFYNLKSAVAAILEKFAIKYNLEYGNRSYLHPGISADIVVNEKVIGSFGKIHPVTAKKFAVSENTFLAEIDLEGIISAEPPVKTYIPLPKFPTVERDMAFTVKTDVSVGSLITAIKDYGGKLVKDIELFDVYQGEQIPSGFKSVAFSVKIVPDERTLNDSEIQDIMNRIIKGICGQFNASLRQ